MYPSWNLLFDYATLSKGPKIVTSWLTSYPGRLFVLPSFFTWSSPVCILRTEVWVSESEDPDFFYPVTYYLFKSECCFLSRGPLASMMKARETSGWNWKLAIVHLKCRSLKVDYSICVSGAKFKPLFVLYQIISSSYLFLFSVLEWHFPFWIHHLPDSCQSDLSKMNILLLVIMMASATESLLCSRINMLILMYS